MAQSWWEHGDTRRAHVLSWSLQSFGAWWLKKVRAVPLVLVGRARQMVIDVGLCGCSGFCLSLLDKRPALGSDEDTPSSSDVVAACRLPLGSVGLCSFTTCQKKQSAMPGCLI